METWALVGLLACACSAARADGPPALDAAVRRDFSAWQIVDAAAGDLDGDGADDFAAILFRAGKGDDQGRALLVVYRAGAAGAPTLFLKAEKAVCVGCGGPKAAFDRPLGELSIAKGVLNIVYEGGSREAFTDATKWRLDRKRGVFVRIGETYTVRDTVGEEPSSTLDVNFSTLKMISRLGRKSRVCAVPAAFKAASLAEFDYEGRHMDELQSLSYSCPLKTVERP